MRYLCFFFLLAACAKNSPFLPEPVSGDLLAPDSLPGVVRVLSRVSCTGTFINSRAVLTAAHCLEGGGPYRVNSNLVHATTSRGYSMVKNKNYGIDDIGILLFESPEISEELVIPIGKEPTVGETVTLIGYGCTDVNSKQGGGVKRMGTNVLTRIADYLEVITPMNNSRSIIGPKNRAGSCFGDSGSPLLQKTGDSYTVVGVDHGARSDSQEQVSLFVNIFKAENAKFIQSF